VQPVARTAARNAAAASRIVVLGITAGSVSITPGCQGMAFPAVTFGMVGFTIPRKEGADDRMRFFIAAALLRVGGAFAATR